MHRPEARAHLVDARIFRSNSPVGLLDKDASLRGSACESAEGGYEFAELAHESMVIARQSDWPRASVRRTRVRVRETGKPIQRDSRTQHTTLTHLFTTLTRRFA